MGFLGLIHTKYPVFKAKKLGLHIHLLLNSRGPPCSYVGIYDLFICFRLSRFLNLENCWEPNELKQSLDKKMMGNSENPYKS